MERPGFGVHLWLLLLIQVAMWTVPCVSVDLGDSCTDTANCTVPISVCNGTLCQCEDSHYQSSSTTCTKRVDVGQQCTPGGAGGQRNCVAGAVCDSNNTCKTKLKEPCTVTSPNSCQSGTECVDVTGGKQCRIPAGSQHPCNNDPDSCVPSALCETDTCKTRLKASCTVTSPNSCQTGTDCVDVAGGGKQCRKIYGSDCNAGDECQKTKNEDCLQKKCLCSSDFFRSNNNVCMRVTSLKVGGPTQTGAKEETSVTVHWTKPTMVNTSEYRASLDHVQSWSAWSANLAASFSRGLTPGEEYTVTVSTRTKKDPHHGDTMVQNDNSGSVRVYTKPAIPGKLIVGDHKVPRVTLTFHPSNGMVDKYEVTVNGTKKDVFSSSTPSATFTHLVAETNYTVTIVAFSHGFQSNDQTDTFYVDAAGAGVVSNLRVPQHGGRWSEVTWGKPVEPNGDITGYTVTMVNGTCVSGVAVLCFDCSSRGSSTPLASGCASQSNILMTSSELDSGVQVNVTHLQPDVMYTVLVNAYNQKGRGTDTENYVTTNEEAALTLKAVTLTTPGVKQLLVSWEPVERTGPTTYTVSWSEKQSLTSNVFVPKDSINISGYENTSHLIKGLLNYWEYEVSVFPFTPVSDPRANVTTETQTTSPTEPGVVNFTITQSDDTAQKVVLTAQCPGEKERNGHIVFISYTATVTHQGAYTNDPPVGNITVTGDCEVGPHQIDVVAEASYNFTVFAKTSTHDGNSTTQQITIAARPPTLRPSGGATVLAVAGTSTSSQVTVELCRCVVSPDQGHIVLAGITLCVETQTTTTECSADISKLQQSKYQGLPSWKQFMKNGAKGQYRVTSDDFPEVIAAASRTRRSVSRRQARSTAGFVSFTIGDNTSCDSLDENVFCNGPLPEGKEFQLIIWACTTDGCTEADGVTISTLLDDGSDIGPIIGAVVAVVVVIIIAVVVVVLLLRRRKRDGSGNPRPEPAYPLTPVSVSPDRRPVKLQDFAAHLERFHRDSNLMFQKEYKDIEDMSPKHYSQEAAFLESNRMKTRFVNILPYDHTRVKLDTDVGDTTSDFINANYITGYRSPREYIATQGPMVSTVCDFWRMVWEQKSSLIVMLSDLKEKGRPGVEKYWPEDRHTPVHYEEIVVAMTPSTVNPFPVRTFKVCKEDQKGDVRRVVQYFLPGWEEHSSNMNPNNVLDFITATRREARSSQGPIIVHCSSGVGRTAVFIALDFLMQYVEDHGAEDEVDIFNLVLTMRHSRPLMVQTEKQYIFIHDTLKKMIDRKLQAMQEEHPYTSLDHVYINEDFNPYDSLHDDY